MYIFISWKSKFILENMFTRGFIRTVSIYNTCFVVYRCILDYFFVICFYFIHIISQRCYFAVKRQVTYFDVEKTMQLSVKLQMIFFLYILLAFIASYSISFVNLLPGDTKKSKLLWWIVENLNTTLIIWAELFLLIRMIFEIEMSEMIDCEIIGGHQSWVIVSLLTEKITRVWIIVLNRSCVHYVYNWWLKFCKMNIVA